MTQVAVSPARRIGRIDRKVFGGFVEHLGRCVYGGLHDEGSPLSDGRGFRQDVLRMLRELNMGVLRWPGGNFVSNYHWQDGIGPKDERPNRPELAWDDEESNRFGTDEFLAYCAELGTEPYICLNMGTGTLAEALEWVEYCNSTKDTYWAKRREHNGRKAAYNVKYWGLGNEMYGDWQVGAVSAEEYVREASRWARAIKMLDPGARLVSCGMNGWSDWDRVVIDGMAPLVDYHSIHIYTGSDDYWTNVLQPHQAQRAITTAKTLIRRAAYLRKLNRPPRIAYDEWNVWFRQMTGGLEERYTFPDALAVATYLNIFVRNADWVAMANLAQMVNAIAPIVTTHEAAAAQPIYYPVLLHARAALEFAVDTHVDGATVSPDLPPDASRWPHHVADLAPFTLLDAAASVTDHSVTDHSVTDHSNRQPHDGTERIAVTVVNRSPDPEPARITLRDFDFASAVSLTTVTEGGAADRVALPGIAPVRLAEGTETPKDGTVVLTLPPRSFTVAEAAIAPSR